MQISVIGTGYVGLVAGACFADTGNTVICVDTDPNKVEKMRKGESPIYEPGLETLLHRGIKENRLHFTTKIDEAVGFGGVKTEVYFMAVGTPPMPSGEPDLKYLKQAAADLAQALARKQPKGSVVIVNKSTVPIGAHIKLREWVSAHYKGEFDVVSNPEFLKEGSAVDDFLKPDRVVIGTNTDEAYSRMQELYTPFVRQGNPILRMDPISAEMTKYACNSFLATRISFINELSRLCDQMGGDIELVRAGMTSDVRIGKHFLYPGVGYGGSCFPKDVQALVHTAKSNGIKLGIIEAAEEANARQKHVLAEMVTKHFGSVSGKKFAVWGLAFKPNTDDMREAPAITICEDLLQGGAKLSVFDPVAMDNAKASFEASSSTQSSLKKGGCSLEFAKTIFDTVSGADAILLVTEWNEFRHPDWDRVLTSMKTPIVFDGRNIYSPARIRSKGFKYFGIGRPRG